MDQATKSNAIVSSLFPSNVRDRLMEEIKVDQEKNRKSWGEKGAFMNNGHDRSATGMRCATSETIFGRYEKKCVHAIVRSSISVLLPNLFLLYQRLSSQPIAELFPEATIML